MQNGKMTHNVVFFKLDYNCPLPKLEYTFL